MSSRLLVKNFKIKIYKTIILPAVLYGCEAWSLTLREECVIRVFEHRILRSIFGPKKNANTERRGLHSEEVYSWYRSSNIVRVVKFRRLIWVGHVVRIEKSRSALKRSTGIPTGKRPLGRPRHI